jgi:hypothetical protein
VAPKKGGLNGKATTAFAASSVSGRTLEICASEANFLGTIRRKDQVYGDHRAAYAGAFRSSNPKGLESARHGVCT